MSNIRVFILGFFLLGIPLFSLFSQTISEKKSGVKSSETDLDQETENFLIQNNKETKEIHSHIQNLYEKALLLYQENSDPEEYRSLLEQINDQKRYLKHLEHKWRELITRSNRAEGYGLWHAPETTLEQLIIDYGSQDYVYLIPPEVGAIKLSINSNLPILYLLSEMLNELILTQNGVGIKTLNPYLRQLYLIQNNHSQIHSITNNKQDLEVLPPETKVSFVFSPEPSEVRRTFSFLDKFINPNTTVLRVLGRDISLLAQLEKFESC